MFAKLNSVAVFGMETYLLQIETDISEGVVSAIYDYQIDSMLDSVTASTDELDSFLDSFKK